MPVHVPKEIQLAVDAYIQLYEQSKSLKAEMDALRPVFEFYMNEHELPHIAASNGTARIERSTQERPTQNARYTTYNLEQLQSHLTTAQRKKCVVEVIDKERLEALCKLGELPGELLNMKDTKLSTQFAVKANKNG